MSQPNRIVLHVLPNAHLDPVWLWDWRDGLNEGLITVEAVLNLMDEYPDLTFMRGESAIYEHIQKTDPALFKRIRQRVEEGRWEVVGGTVIQPDTNLASTEVLCRQFERGLGYFEKTFGVRPTVAWQADSFGHTPGLPNIFSSFGIDAFAYTRPQERDFHLDTPAFWWEGDFNNRILCYRQYHEAYCSERENMRLMLDSTLKAAQAGHLTHACVLCGLGNHGGGPTRRNINEVYEWRAEHPEVEVRYDTLHGFFADLRKEVTPLPESLAPVIRGEFGYTLRGCYASVQKFKSLYRNGEARVADAETTRSAINAATETQTPNLNPAWDALLFNAFHDILPGTSIERGMEDQAHWVASALHRAHEVKFEALNQLAAKVDMTVPAPRRADVATDVPVLLWNPLPRPFVGLTEVEITLDYRPIWAFKDRPDDVPLAVFGHTGEPMPFQIILNEHSCMLDVAWRKRVVVPVEIPALGWTTLRIGWRDEPEAPPVPPVCTARRDAAAPQISNGEWSVEVLGETVRIQRNGKNFFSGEKNLEIYTLEDRGGSWGGRLEKTLDPSGQWKLEQSEVLEEGPLRAKLWTRWKGKNSWVDLTFSVGAGTPELTVGGRMLINERSARIKVVFPCEGEVEADMPGGKIVRDAEGQVPMARWVTRSSGGKTVGFASDVLSDSDATPETLGVTLARASRYGNSETLGPEEKVWRPAVDCGELKFQFCLFDETVNPDDIADKLLFSPTMLTARANGGPWPRQGSLGSIEPSSMRLLSLEETQPGQLKARIQNRARNEATAVMHFGEDRIVLGNLHCEEIATFLLDKDNEGRWKIGSKQG